MAMTTIARTITGGVDTHLDVHVAAAPDERGALLGVESFSTTPKGYGALLDWLEEFGTVELVGVEGTGSYGAGLTRHLHHHGIAVVEVDRPNRQRRRRQGKSDPLDAVAAARAAQGGDALGQAKTRDGNVEAMRVLRVARSSARRSRTQAINQIRSLISTAPDELRSERRDLSIYQVLTVSSAFRHTNRTDVSTVTKLTLRMLARRAISLEVEVKEIDRLLKTLVAETAPELSAINGVGTDVASALLVAAGGQPRAPQERGHLRQTLRGLTPRRLERQAGASPPQPRRGPSGQLCPLAHRVHSHGVRPEDPALHRAPNEGRTDQKEAIRCLKRYVAREVFAQLPRSQFGLDNP
jgi:transposase